MRIKTIIGVLILIVFAVFSVDLAFSQDDDMLEKMASDEELQQEFKWLKAETYVITASKVMENIKKAPASITVVTDKQIRQMGARYLFEVVRIVPGFGNYKYYTGNTLYGVRGSAGANTTLLMINSHPVNEGASGTSVMYDDLLIDNIERIEFIRGPGSALYGANAFGGVINVITKEAEDIDGFELTARGGSWDTQQYNLLFGKTFSDFEVAFNFNYFKTHGFRGLVKEDLQTILDGMFGSSASLAPGRMAGDGDKYDVSLNLKYKGFTLDGRYVDRDRELPVGFAAALNDKSISSDKDYYMALTYETSMWEELDLSAKAYRNVWENASDGQLFPPGYTAPTLTGLETWAEGLIAITTLNARRTGVEVQATYKISDSNAVVAGGSYEEQKQYDVTERRNYWPVPGTIYLPAVQKWPDNLTAGTQKRNLKAVFLEDIWDITDDIRLTMGARYDYYSDFGGELSPRVGLTWEYKEGYDFKLLYGHAFRAPTFQQLNTPLGGNPDLDPETIDTYEISLGAEFTSSFNSRATYYYRKRKDIITALSAIPPWDFVNLGKERDHGFEIEAKYDFGKGIYLSGNYNYQSFNNGPNVQVGDVMANIRLSRHLNFNADCIFWDGLERPPTDDRDDPSGGAFVNATLIAKKFLKGYEGLELRGSVYNLFDKDWSSPQDYRLPSDLPMPGKNYMVELKYAF